VLWQQLVLMVHFLLSCLTPPGPLLLLLLLLE
jgi:hypothetical protein